jgi:hypothetical protein
VHSVESVAGVEWAGPAIDAGAAIAITTARVALVFHRCLCCGRIPRPPGVRVMLGEGGSPAEAAWPRRLVELRSAILISTQLKSHDLFSYCGSRTPIRTP